jgi:hypothetical protein
MGGTSMMNSTRFWGTLFLVFFSGVAEAMAGQSKPSSPASQPSNLFKEVLDRKNQIQWKPAPQPGIPADVCRLFMVCEDKGGPKMVTLPRATEGGQPIGRGILLSGTKDPKNPEAVILERQTVSELYFFLLSPEGNLQKVAYLQQGSTMWLPIATSLARPAFEKDRNDCHDWVMKLGAGSK